MQRGGKYGPREAEDLLSHMEGEGGQSSATVCFLGRWGDDEARL